MEFLFFAAGAPQRLFNRKAEKRACGWKMSAGTRSRRRFFSTGRPKISLADGKSLSSCLRRRFFSTGRSKKGLADGKIKMAAVRQGLEPSCFPFNRVFRCDSCLLLRFPNGTFRGDSFCNAELPAIASHIPPSPHQQIASACVPDNNLAD